MLFGKSLWQSAGCFRPDDEIRSEFRFRFLPCPFFSGGDWWFDELSIAIYFIAFCHRFRQAGVAFYEVEQSNIKNNWSPTPISQLTNVKWASIGKCSADTALRDINDLLARGALRRLEGGARSTVYELLGWAGKE